MGQCINHRSLTASLLYLTSHQKSTKGTFNGASSATSKMHTTEGINWYSSFHLPAISTSPPTSRHNFMSRGFPFPISHRLKQKHDYNKKGERWSAFFCWLASRPRRWNVCLVSNSIHWPSVSCRQENSKGGVWTQAPLQLVDRGTEDIDILPFAINHSNKLQFSVKHNVARMCLIIYIYIYIYIYIRSSNYA